MNSPDTRETLSRRLKRIVKRTRFRLGPRGRTQAVFVLGYGRSGTTMLLDALDHDMRVEVLGENDPKIARDYLLVREQVGPAIAASRASVVVMKPILNSFNLSDLMREHPTARVVWAYRAYEPVVASALKRFGTSVADQLRAAVVDDRGDGWLKRGIPASTLTRLRSLDSSDFEPTDWMALVWWSVNLTLLTEGLADDDRFLLVRYEDLARNPEAWMRKLYAFIGLEYRLDATEWIDSKRATRNVSIDLNDQVRALCEQLAVDIDRAFDRVRSSAAREQPVEGRATAP